MGLDQAMRGASSPRKELRCPRQCDSRNTAVSTSCRSSRCPGRSQARTRYWSRSRRRGSTRVRPRFVTARWPATFPFGEGSDLAGVVVATGPGVTAFKAGDEVIGWTDNRASHAEYVVTESEKLTPKPPAVPWEVAGALYVAGATAWAAVRAVSLSEGDTVVVAGAAGGVGSLAVQLARR